MFHHRPPVHLLNISALALAIACVPGRCLPAQATPPVAQPAAPAAGATAPVIQLPTDQAAYKAANSKIDPKQRAAALSQFLTDFPTSKRVSNARGALIEVLIEEQPQDVPRIHALAKASIDAAAPEDRGSKENAIAYALAEAPPNGVDLASAERWARDAVKANTLASFTGRMKGSFDDRKPLTPAEEADRTERIRQYWGEGHAAILQTLADVYYREGKLPKANATLDQAEPLAPEEGSLFLTRGEVAHAQHQDAAALEALEKAAVYGGMTPAGQHLLTTLYGAQHGTGSGLEAALDARYRALYPTAPPALHTSPVAGRTLLVALYTGSACHPCVAADLALDEALRTYPRSQVVALAFDQHIPNPDPLANPAGIARATYDDVHYTPTFRIGGPEEPEVYGSRKDADKVFQLLVAAIDKQLAIPAGANLDLTATLTPHHTIAASATFHVTDETALAALLAPKPPTGKQTADAPATEKSATKPAAGNAAPATAEPAAAPAAPPTAPKPAQLVLNFALVQREVRYSGENGIRFHSMVVRDLAKPTAQAAPVALTGASTAAASFDPAAVSAALGRYLTDFAAHSERFGTTRFLSTDTALPLDDLAVAAWVEDLSSHQVITSAYVPLGSGPQQQAASAAATRASEATR